MESAVNELLKLELTGFLDYEKITNRLLLRNSRNGSYSRQLKKRFGEIAVDIPRNRNGEPMQHTVPLYKRSIDDLESMIIRMVQIGLPNDVDEARLKSIHNVWSKCCCVDFDVDNWL